jgi:predicted hydrocarbon binding protein
MKGVIFTAFNDMVEQKVGLAMWEDLLATVNPESGGVYTSVEDFPDQEFLDMVRSLSEKTGQPIEELIPAFGQYLFHVLAFKHSVFTETKPNLIEFLKSIESVIHKVVMKLYEDPNLPTIEWEQTESHLLTLHYQSPRKLCHLASGLIRGAAEHYKTAIDLTESQCMHSGAEKCTFLVRLL